MRLGPGKKKNIPRINIEIIVILTALLLQQIRLLKREIKQEKAFP